jgi:hypothetical protein
MHRHRKNAVTLTTCAYIEINLKGGENVIALYYFRWIGTPKELQEYFGQAKGVFDETDGADLKGMFVPNSEWNFVAFIEATSYDKVMDAYRAYVKKFGPHPKETLAKMEILYTFEELGM